MYYTLSADLLTGYNAFDRRMVLENHSVIAARLSGTNHQQGSAANTNNSNNNNNSIYANSTRARIMGHQGPVVDLLVTMIAVPILILCALQLEKNLHDMTNSPESRWLVFALGVGMLIVSVIICGYVTHRMGVCIWAGPIDEAGNRVSGRSGSNVTHINSQNDILRFVDSLPPSYESVVKFDIPPPPYDCVVIDMKEDDDNNEDHHNNSGNTPNNNNNSNGNEDVAGTRILNGQQQQQNERTPQTTTTSTQRPTCKEPQLPDYLATMHI